MAARPEAGDLRIPPLVRRQRRVEERYAESDREQREAERRSGPPCPDLTPRALLVAGTALVAALVIAVSQLGLGLTPDRYLVVLLIPAITLGQPKKYLVDFIPFAVLLVFYSTCRGLAHSIHPSPFAKPQLSLERFLFAGHVPTVELQHWLGTARTSLPVRSAITMTQLHFIVPPLLGFALWLKRRALFYRFAATMLALSFVACAVFLVYPSAPPWAAAQQHLTPPLVHLTHHTATASAGASGVANASMTRLIPKNPYAAIPSLHAGYAFLVFLFVVGVFGRGRWRRPVIAVALLYPVLQSLAVIYTGDHYVVDVLLGFAAATAAYVGVTWAWRAARLPT